MTTKVTVCVPESANWVAVVELEENNIKQQALVMPGKDREFTIYDGKSLRITELKDKY